MAQTYLSTADNPFNPATDFDRWYEYDEQMGYHTCSYLMRVAKISPELSDDDNEAIVNEAIDEICALNLTGNYIKVVN